MARDGPRQAGPFATETTPISDDRWADIEAAACTSLNKRTRATLSAATIEFRRAAKLAQTAPLVSKLAILEDYLQGRASAADGLIRLMEIASSPPKRRSSGRASVRTPKPLPAEIEHLAVVWGAQRGDPFFGERLLHPGVGAEELRGFLRRPRLTDADAASIGSDTAALAGLDADYTKERGRPLQTAATERFLDTIKEAAESAGLTTTEKSAKFVTLVHSLIGRDTPRSRIESRIDHWCRRGEIKS